MQPIVYRTDDLSQWGFGQGSDLTNVQVDNNFWNLNVRVASLEASHAFKQIHYMFEANGQIFVVYTDGSMNGPFPIPTATFNWVGKWLPNTPYSTYNILYFNGGIYSAVTNFTSGASFATNDGFGTTWLVLWLLIPSIPVVTVTTSSFTPDLTFANTYIRCTNPGGCLVTLPTPGTVPWADATEMQFYDGSESGSGVMIQASAPSYINPEEGHENQTGWRGAKIGVKLVDTPGNGWDIFGGLLVT